MEEETLYSSEELEAALGWELRRYYPRKPTEHRALQVSELFENLRKAINDRDAVAVTVGSRLIAVDPRLPFGKLIKSGVARSLRRNADLLSSEERQAIITKTFQLLDLPFAPREVEDYCKLVKKFEPGEWRHLLAGLKPKNDRSERLVLTLASRLRDR